jgi:lantibiotic biosynthesis protein
MRDNGKVTRHSAAPRWRPVVEEDLRESAIETVLSIARELRKTQVKDPSLALGLPGVALLFAYLAKAQPDRGYEEIALRLLERAARAVLAKRMSASLYSGFTGVAWTVIHLKRLLGLEGEYPNAEIDRALSMYLRASLWRSEFDLISGLTGLGVYALECWPRSTAASLLKQIVRHLCRNAESNSVSWTWRSRVEFLSPDRRRTYPDGCYDLGLAHGVPGIIALLGRIGATRNERFRATRARTRGVLDGAVHWLLAQESDGSEPSIFPICLGANGEAPTPALRVGWCYGDLGIATALFLAARCANEPTWELRALSLARRAANRPRAQSGVNDTSLCHGAAGIAHLFNRFYQATGERTFRDAARFWFRQTLEMRQQQSRVAGFPARFYKRSAGAYWSPQPGFLYGAAGIGLALLSAATPVEPAWDRIMLVSQ